MGIGCEIHKSGGFENLVRLEVWKSGGVWMWGAGVRKWESGVDDVWAVAVVSGCGEAIWRAGAEIEVENGVKEWMQKLSVDNGFLRGWGFRDDSWREVMVSVSKCYKNYL